jgi:hypothetical protein
VARLVQPDASAAGQHEPYDAAPSLVGEGAVERDALVTHFLHRLHDVVAHEVKLDVAAVARRRARRKLRQGLGRRAIASDTEQRSTSIRDEYRACLEAEALT